MGEQPYKSICLVELYSIFMGVIIVCPCSPLGILVVSTRPSALLDSGFSGHPQIDFWEMLNASALILRKCLALNSLLLN